MITDSESFVRVVGELTRLVVVATVLERALAFVYEHDWFIRLTTRPVKKGSIAKDLAKGASGTEAPRENIIPGLKGFLTLLAAQGITFRYQMDILHALFSETYASPDSLGMMMTGFVLAGGSAGAITVFQGYLGISKQSRDALIESRAAEASGQVAAAEAQMKSAEADKLEAEARLAEAQARLKRANLTKEEPAPTLEPPASS